MRRVAHGFLCRFPLWLFGAVATAAGLAIAAAQVWAGARTFVEAIYASLLVVANSSYSLLIALLIVGAWLLACYLTRPIYRHGAARATMPLSVAAWHIARRSQWAERYPPENDDQWISSLNREIRDKLGTSSLRAWGRLAPDHRLGDSGPSKIPADYWANANLTLWQLCSEQEPWGSEHNERGGYSDIHFDPREVYAVWPRRSLWAHITRKSPVERIEKAARRKGETTYADLEKAQRENYRRHQR